MTSRPNPELELAYRFVNETHKHIFLTGKAGTGKTTFLKNLRETTKKRNIIVAPTGVAALNAGGVTIHSMFQLPFGVIAPGQDQKSQHNRKMRQDKIILFRSLDLLIIDEISMVRADVMDAISHVLQRYRRSNAPFGGVQLLMIGDLHQLPPVVVNREKAELMEHYQSPYFFSSHSLSQNRMVTLELKHIYRQKDQEFVNLLNEVRDNQISKSTIQLLNSRYSDKASNDDNGIILTSHRRTSQKINSDKIKELKATSYSYGAEVDGVFPESSYPADEKLELKKGARVMFVKNDLSGDQQYYNGKLAHVIDIDEHKIVVKCDDELVINVTQETWENTKPVLNTDTKLMEDEVIGSFAQYPIRLAWAITIHKSQGLTFDQVVIDAGDAFAHGQVYVALSRCRTLEGITLLSKINERSVYTDGTVSRFDKRSKGNAPSTDHLMEAITEYESYLLKDIFDFRQLKYWQEELTGICKRHDNSLGQSTLEECSEAGAALRLHCTDFADKFLMQINTSVQDNRSIRDNESMMARLPKSGAYFYEKLQKVVFPKYESIEIVTKNKAVRERLEKQIEVLKKEIYIKGMTMKSLISGLDSQQIATTKANADIAFENKFDKKKKTNKKTKKSSINELLNTLTNKELYELLVDWRKVTAEDNGLDPSNVMTLKTLIELSKVLPSSLSVLKQIHGISKVRAGRYGEELIEIIGKYCAQNRLEANNIEHASKALQNRTLPTSAEQSVAMIKDGKSASEIAEERNLALSTIQGHLANGIRFGLLDIDAVMDKTKSERIIAFLTKADTTDLTPAKQHFGNEVSYDELRIVRNWITKSTEKT